MQENIVITVNDNGTPVVKRNFNDVAGAADKAGKSVDGFNKSLSSLSNWIKAISGMLLIDKIIQYADAWTEAQNKIRVFTQSAAEAQSVHLALFKVIQDSRQAMSPMVALYSRVAQAAGNLGASQQQVIDFSEGVAKALAVQGVSTTAARGALLQLGQAMGMAKLRAQEFNSINEQAPIILQVVAKQLYGVNGSVAQMRDEMLQGKVTSKTFYDAFMSALPQLRKQFAETTPTIGQAFTVLNNSIIRFVGTTNQATGMSGVFAKAIIALAMNLDTLQKTLLSAMPLIVLWVGTYLVRALAAARAAMIALTVAAMANPFVAVATIIATVITTLYAFGDRITTTLGQFITLRDYMVGGWNLIAAAATSAWKSISGGTSGVLSEIYSIVSNMVTQLAADISSLWQNTLPEINQFIAAFVGAYNSIVGIWNNAPAAFYNTFANVYNSVVGMFDKLINAVMGAYNSLFEWLNDKASAVGMDNLFKIKPVIDLNSTKMQLKGDGQALGDIVGTSFSKALQTDYIGAAKNALNNAARNAATDRMMSDVMNRNGVDLSTPRTATPYNPVDQKALRAARVEAEKLQKALQQVEKTLDPTIGAQNDYSRSLATLQQAEKAGLITKAAYAGWVDKLNDHYRDSINPLGALQRSLALENAQYLVAIQDMDAYKTVSSQVLDLKKKGVTLTQQQIQGLIDQANAQKTLEAVASAAKGYANNGTSAQYKAQYEQYAGLKIAMQQGQISATQYSVALGQIGIKLGEISAASDKASVSGFFNGSLKGVMEGYKGMLPGVQDAFSNFYGSLADGMANSIGKAIVYGDSLKDSLLSVAKEITSSLIAALVKLGIQYVVNAAIGKSTETGSTALSVANAAATASAWAPAAAMVSLATSGANSVPASAGVTAVTGLTKALSIATGAGFRQGGYTGNGGVNEVAGAVHGQEYVFDADSTRRIGVANLERLRATGDTTAISNRANSTVSSGASVNVVNQSNGTVSPAQMPAINQTFHLSATSDKQIADIIETAAAQGSESAYNRVMSDAQRNGPIRKAIRGG